MAAVKEVGISKMEAVRKALKELGKDAMPVKIQEFVKSKFGLDMTPAHVSNYKTTILRAKNENKTAPAKAAPAKTESNAPKAAPVKATPAPAKATSGAAVSLQDIEAVKGLVGRVGQANLKSLIGMLGG